MTLLDTPTGADLAGAFRRGLGVVRSALADAWHATRRPNQIPPPMTGSWLVWLILAGRGWGKTRTGAETVVAWARRYPGCQIALVAPTYTDGRDIMVEGVSGVLAVLDPSELRGGSRDAAWNRSLGELFLANGSHFKVFTAERPNRLRGPQHHFAWGDELAAWDDAHLGVGAAGQDTTYSMLMFGLRLPALPGWPGDFQPRMVATTTPKPVALLRVPAKIVAKEPHRAGLLQLASTHLTTGHTTENLDNLSPTFKANVVDPLSGTTLGRQELNAELIDDVEGAYLSRNQIDQGRRIIGELPHLLGVVVAVDPATTANSTSDETGIVVVGVDDRGDGWVLDDRTEVMSPDEWGRAVWEAVIDHNANAIVIEDNAGGDMVQHVLETTYDVIEAARRRRGLATPVPAIERVHPTGRGQGKWIRALQVQPLYEQGRIHHLIDPSRPGVLDGLEDQLTTWTGHAAEDSPDHIDALVHGLSWLLFPRQRSAKKSAAGRGGRRRSGRR